MLFVPSQCPESRLSKVARAEQRRYSAGGRDAKFAAHAHAAFQTQSSLANQSLAALIDRRDD